MTKKPRFPKPLKQHPFEEYIVYRHRLTHFLHVQDAMLYLIESQKPPSEEHLATLRLLSVSYLAGFFDTYDDSLKVFDVWREYLPQHTAAIDKAQEELTPLLEKAKDIRNRVVCHSNLSIEAQNHAIGGLPQEDAVKLLDGFFQLAHLIVKSERDIPELAKEIKEWVLRPGDDIPLA